MEITRIKDRLVVHFLNFVNDKDREKAQAIADKTDYPGANFVLALCSIAENKSKPFGGKKYRGRQYGGGIAFSWSAWGESQLKAKVQEIQNL
jgi:hypothetical protein